MASKSARRPNLSTENMTATSQHQPQRSPRNQRVGEGDSEVAVDEAQVSPTSEEGFEMVEESVITSLLTLAVLW